MRFADRGGDWPLGVVALALGLATAFYFVPIVAGILGLAPVIWAGALVWLILSEL